MSIQTNRIETSRMIDNLRYGIEQFYGKTLTGLRGEKYQGTFDVRLNTTNKSVDQTFANVYTEGEIIFYPSDENMYASLKRFREDGDGINLTSMSKSKKLESHLDGEELKIQREILDEIFDLLHQHGGMQIHRLITEAKNATNYGSPEITMNFGGQTSDIDVTPQAFSSFLQKVTSLVEEKVTAA